jgi:hypothetical protein
MLDTIRIAIKNVTIVKRIVVQDIYSNKSIIEAFRWPTMERQGKRIVKASPYTIKTGEYYPSLTLRPHNNLYIEFSAPKIVYGNNVDELCNTDLPRFLELLEAKLFDMGFNITQEQILHSRVSFCTVSKNIEIEEVGATEFIEFTRRLWWRWRYLTKIESFKSNGIALRNYSETTGIGIYAKVPSLQDIKTKTDKELELTQTLKENNILRFEYRMQNYQRTLAKYSWAKGYSIKELRFRDIFDSELSKKILLYDLNKSLFSSDFKLITMQLPNIKKMYSYIMNQNLTPLEEMTVIAVFRLCSDLGINQAKEIFESRYSQSTTKRAFNICKKILNEFRENDFQQINTKIKKTLLEFLPYKVKEINLNAKTKETTQLMF